jgi:hypothetical protein
MFLYFVVSLREKLFRNLVYLRHQINIKIMKPIVILVL